MGQSESTHKISAQDKAILDMKNQRDKLHQYQRKITLLTDRETSAAREMLARGDKPRALLALRRKKYQQSLLAKTDAQLEQLEHLTSSVEFALVQKDVVFGLQQGTTVLKEIQKEMGGIENIEKLMGENEESLAYQREVSDLLSTRMSNQDEDEVEDELDALTQAISGPPSKLPDVPSQEISQPVPGSMESVSDEQRERARARARTREQDERREEEPMLA